MKKIFLFLVFSFSFLSFAQAQWTPENISTGRFHLGATSTDDLLFFAGGTVSGLAPSPIVDIYNTNTKTWSITELSRARSFPAVAANGNLIFVAGGNDIRTDGAFDVVDIYDTTTGTWSQEQLSSPRSGMAAVSVGSKVIFAGGGTLNAFLTGFQTSDIVDIYDVETQTWETAQLSEPRFFLAATVIGDKAYFGGGAVDNNTMSKRIDIYDAETNTWSVDSLSTARGFLSATTVKDKILFAGGHDAAGISLVTVDIFNTSTQEWTTGELSVPRMGMNAISICDKAYFIGGGDIDWNTKVIIASSSRVDVYDAISETWETEELSARRTLAATAANEKSMAVVGGFDALSGLPNTAEIMSCEVVPVLNFIEDQNWLIYPNPNQGHSLVLKLPQPNNFDKLQMYDTSGRMLLQREVNAHIETQVIDLAGLENGIYWVHLKGTDGKSKMKRIMVERG